MVAMLELSAVVEAMRDDEQFPALLHVEKLTLDNGRNIKLGSHDSGFKIFNQVFASGIFPNLCVLKMREQGLQDAGLEHLLAALDKAADLKLKVGFQSIAMSLTASCS